MNNLPPEICLIPSHNEDFSIIGMSELNWVRISGNPSETSVPKLIGKLY